MKSSIKTLVAILLLASISFNSKAQISGEFIELTIPAPSLANNMFNEPAFLDIAIYLPPSYDQVDYAFPVLYFLTGWGCGGSPETLISGYDERLAQENMEEMIYVRIKGCNILLGSFYINNPVIGNWEDAIRYDLVNYIDSNYRTIRKNQCRGIAGHSMGGFGALHLSINNPDIFNSYYGGSPALYLNDGLDELFGFNNEEMIKGYIDYLESLIADDLETEFANLNSSYLDQSSGLQLVISNGSAFAPDTAGHVPFLHFPYSINENKQIVQNDSIKNLWYNGMGNWDQKINGIYSVLSSFDTLMFNYGDEEEDLGRGVRNVYNLLRNRDVEASILVHQGGHNEADRFFTQMFPAMSTTLWRDSSRFRTGTEILAFELENQVKEATIDSEAGTVEAFVSETTDIEAIKPHMILSDGARETPLANQELDFSWGPISFRVISGDGQHMKLWTISVTQVSTSSSDVQELEELKLYPNPARNQIYISFPFNFQYHDIKVYNLMGEVCKIKFNKDNNSIDISHLPEGIYLLKIIGEKIYYASRFVKN